MKQLSHHTLPAVLGLILFALTLFSCSSKPKRDPNKTYQEISADAFTAIRASKAINVRFKQSKDATPEITIVCKNEYAPYIDVHMEGTVLVATYKRNAKIIADTGVEVLIEAPSINEIEADMAAIVNLGDELKLNGDLRIKCDHAGSVKCKKLSCNNLVLDATNASVMQIANITANDVRAKATNSASIHLEGKANSSTIQQVYDKQIRFERLNTTNGHVEYVHDIPLPEVKKKEVPAAPSPVKAKTAADSTKTSAPQKP